MTLDVNDGDFYLSRCRVNRHVIDIIPPDFGEIRLNGKVSKVVVDSTAARLLPGPAGNHGQLKFFMDIKDGAGDNIQYFDTIGKLNFTGSGSDVVSILEVSPGSNKGTSSSKNSLAFSVSAPTNAESGGVVINEPTAWNGLVCGLVKISVDNDPASGSILDPTSIIRVIIYLE